VFLVSSYSFDFSFVLDIEDLIVRVVIVGIILTFRSLTQEALEMVCALLLENLEMSSYLDFFNITRSYR